MNHMAHDWRRVLCSNYTSSRDNTRHTTAHSVCLARATLYCRIENLPRHHDIRQWCCHHNKHLCLFWKLKMTFCIEFNFYRKYFLDTWCLRHQTILESKHMHQVTCDHCNCPRQHNKHHELHKKIELNFLKVFYFIFKTYDIVLEYKHHLHSTHHFDQWPNIDFEWCLQRNHCRHLVNNKNQ